MVPPVFKTDATRRRRVGWVRFPHVLANAAVPAVVLAAVPAAPVARPERSRRALRRLAAPLALALIAVAMPAAGAAQSPDSARVGVATPPRDSAQALQLPQPPISPRRAFVTSLLLPGYAQARLDRPSASALFFGIEAASVLMLVKTSRDLSQARRFAADSVPLAYALDPATGLVARDEAGLPVVATWEPGPFTAALVRARRLHREDWIAAILFNHFFAGAEAFVSAHLWDVPAAVSLSATPRGGTVISASLRW